MKDYLAQVEKLRKDAAECALIRDLATEKDKRFAPRVADRVNRTRWDGDCVTRVCQDGICGAKPPCNGSGEFEDIASGECYRIGTTAMTWSAALADCAAWGGSLAGISSQAEQDFLFAHKSNNNCWIGFNDIQAEGTFAWVNGETSSYTHWLAGEPNNNGGNEDCGQFAGGYAKPPSTVGFWNDANCSGTACFYCER